MVEELLDLAAKWRAMSMDNCGPANEADYARCYCAAELEELVAAFTEAR